MRRIAGVFLVSSLVTAQQPSRDIALTVPAGAPLRLYLTERIPKRLNAPVRAKLLSPLYAFDREVVPIGTEVLGTVTSLPGVSRAVRTKAMLGGDFTPLHNAEVKFTTLKLADGREMPIETVESAGLSSIYPVKPPKARKQTIKEQISDRIAEFKSIPSLVRAPGKKDMLTDFLWGKLPYHPQYVHSRTRFDAELARPLSFGASAIPSSSLAKLGSQPADDAIVHAHLVTSLDSKTATVGQPIQAVLDAPLFSAAHELILPEGTHVGGTVVMARKAGWFHHAGRLRFTFENVQLAPEALALIPSASEENSVRSPRLLHFRTQAILKAAESGGVPVKVDGEGGVRAADPATRFLGVALAVLGAVRSGPGDSDRSTNGTTTQDRNSGGRALGGGTGFGLIGTLAAEFSTNVSLGFGYYGLARTVYFSIIDRGPETEFQRNAAIDIGFNSRK